MDLHVDFTLLRLLVDFIILGIAYRVAYDCARYIRKVRDSKIRPSSSQGFCILSEKSCEVISIQFYIVVGEYGLRDNLFDEITIYLTIKIKDPFHILLINLPFEATSSFEGEEDGAKISMKEGESKIIIVDKSTDRNFFSAGNILINVKGEGVDSIGRQELFFKVDDPWASGRPFRYGRPYPALVDGEYTEHYSPKIGLMEVVFDLLNNYSYRPDYKNSLPIPNYISSRQMRWYTGETGDNFKEHTSIIAAFECPKILDEINNKQFQANIWFALASAAGVTLLLDIVWTAMEYLLTKS